MHTSPAAGSGPKAWFAATAALVFAVAFAVADAAAAKPVDRLPEFMNLSGVATIFDHVAATMKPAVRQALADANNAVHAGFSDDFMAAVDSAIDTAFAPEALRREYLRAMDGRLDDGDLDTIIAFDKSPLGMRIVAMEVASAQAEPDTAAKMAAELAEDLRNNPERAEVLRLLESTMRLTEVWTDQYFNLRRTLSVSMAIADGSMLRPSDLQAIDAALEEERPAVVADIRSNVTPFMAYSYRDASVPELHAYLAFMTSPAGEKLYAANVQAANQILVKAGTEFGWTLLRELGKERR